MAEGARLTYDIDAIRGDFPALRLQPYGKPLVYLDNAASAQKPRQVLDRMIRAYETEYANVHRGLHYLANAATEAYEEARENCRAFINAPSAEEVIFTKNATEAYNLVASSLGRHLNIGEGDEILLSIMEHHSNIVPWHFWREQKGAVIKWAPVDEDGNFLFEEFEKLISPRTKVISITMMSNALGTIVPVKEVCALAKKHGIPVLVDGAQAAVHLDIDVQDIGCDFFVMTGHKLYGPSGIGVLWGRKALLDAMPPFLGGGEMIRTVTEETVTYNESPHRFEAGTPPLVQAIGLGEALKYINAIGKPAIRAHEDALVRYAHERLGEINSIRIIGKAKHKSAVVSFAFENAHAHDVATVIDHYGVAVRAGTHCTMPLLARFGVTATCRASFGLYNTRAEVDALAQALRKAEALFA
ncbi:MAG: cysteine desulfurase [Methylocystis sp.]|nr:cysteine desulfurase [Methylocystis sp.]MCA3592361.1 cysteine desulfurase [Methylocystis sp.]